MPDEGRAKKTTRGEEDFVVIEGEEVDTGRTLPLCLIGKVVTGKPFNDIRFLEAMKRAMNPSKGFTPKEIGLNLFSFHFRCHVNLKDVKRREPWHFEKNLVLLKEIGKGEQPSAVAFTTMIMWVRLYDLPMAAKSIKYIHSIANRCREIMEIDKDSTEGFGRSIRVKIALLLLSLWHDWAYEKRMRLCGKKRELINIPGEKLPLGEWIKASPAKKAYVTTINTKEKRVTSLLQHRLFEKLKAEIVEENTWVLDSTSDGTTSPADGVNEISEDLKKIAVREEM
ncbi:hypothetical protein ACS0TY_032984 [Phlomoides rotata]